MVTCNAATRKEPHIRIQKSRSGKFVMYVFVYWAPKKDEKGNIIINPETKKPEYEKQQKYFSTAFHNIHNYITGQTSAYFLIAGQMISKDSEQYKKFLAESKAIDNGKTRKNPTRVTKVRELEDNNELVTANDPIFLKTPMSLK